MTVDKKKRCTWCGSDPLYVDYHDHEWGVPVHDEQRLFEFLILEGAQAGLSWITVLKKREAYRQLFADFNPQKIARFTDKRLEKLLLEPGIIRNRLKIFAARKNARAFLQIQKEYTSFDHYIWRFVDGKTKHNNFKLLKDCPATTDISVQMSKDLKQRHFTFVGPTICYAFMQAIGMVNDHTTDCFRYQQLKGT
ncbi:MAG: DNA-3-methyladenine glycosylase I [Gammaproteobacteria bacterium]|nr:DNA-3-methyladenine glycosylase I [Gammaproteobacteria bacterium]